MKNKLGILLLLALLLTVFSCTNESPDDNIPTAGWTFITGYDFPIFTAKFGGVMSTSADGDLLEFMAVGDSTGFDDADDWVIQTYEAKEQDLPVPEGTTSKMISATVTGR